MKKTNSEAVKIPMKEKILIRKLASFPDFKYLLRLSKNPDPTRVIVVVHGISRHSGYMLRCLEEKAQELNYTLIAPMYSRWHYRDYQRLGRHGHRADNAFDAMLDDVATYTGLKVPFHLLGFSGGAQFSHRYVYAYPHKARSLMLISAGWYTNPECRQPFPIGTSPCSQLDDLDFHSENILSTPTFIAVGENDTQQDSTVRNTKHLNTTQGLNRTERAQWFHKKIQQLSEDKNKKTYRQFDFLPNTGHDFGEAIIRGGLSDRVFYFCEEVLG